MFTCQCLQPPCALGTYFTVLWKPIFSSPNTFSSGFLFFSDIGKEKCLLKYRCAGHSNSQLGMSIKIADMPLASKFFTLDFLRPVINVGLPVPIVLSEETKNEIHKHINRCNFFTQCFLSISLLCQTTSNRAMSCKSPLLFPFNSRLQIPLVSLLDARSI